MSYFIEKMKKLGSSLKSCADFAVAPFMGDMGYFTSDRDAAGALLLAPALVVTAITSAVAVVAAAFLIVVKGVLGGLVAAAQDGYAILSRRPSQSAASRSTNDSYYSSTSTQLYRTFENGSTPAAPVKPAGCPPLVQTGNNTRDLLPSEMVDPPEPKRPVR